MNNDKRLRLDQLLVELGHIETRSRARDIIKRGCVHVDGALIIKAGAMVSAGSQIEILPDAHPFVSRGGMKLAAALDHFDLDPRKRIALDIGASTGGFTDCLLQRGAAKVYAVDVGQGQLHPSLQDHKAVCSLENHDIRNLRSEVIAEPIDVIVIDVSFISLAQIFPLLCRFMAPQGWMVALIKPQFELEAQDLGKGGIVRSQDARARALVKIDDALKTYPQWQKMGIIPSPLLGQNGNKEFLLAVNFSEGVGDV